LRLLLDTHALIWWTIDFPRLPQRARAAIAEPENEVFVSAVSALEVATKHRLGKLPQAGRLAISFETEVAVEGFLELPVSIRHGRLAGSLSLSHKDPFDRLLIAQSILEDMVLVSNETVFDDAGVARLW
jgi:PIN domain nuclease of toxin-antitoxin system